MDEGRSLLTVYYLDTSALVRIVTREGDTSAVERALLRSPTTSELTRLELRSAIFHRWRQRIESDERRDALLRTVARQIDPDLTFLPLSDKVIQRAIEVTSEHSVPSLDAIHLATADIAARYARRHGTALHFCTADRRQSLAAEGMFGAASVLFVPPSR